MFEIKNLYHKDAPDWLCNGPLLTEIADARALEFAHKGYVLLLRHYKKVFTKSICPHCKQIVRVQSREYLSDLGPVQQ
jgi:hypothetical protein